MRVYFFRYAALLARRFTRHMRGTFCTLQPTHTHDLLRGGPRGVSAAARRARQHREPVAMVVCACAHYTRRAPCIDDDRCAAQPSPGPPGSRNIFFGSCMIIAQSDRTR